MAIAQAVAQILEASQRNNARAGVTGALMFNAGAFAQVLEGPQEGVEGTFERIQCDPRHGDVTVLQCGPAERRGFESWSMAFVGQSSSGQARFSSLSAESGFDLARLDLDGAAARTADQVVVVAGARAGAVDGLALGVAQHIHLTQLGHGLQDPVGRGQGDGLAALAQSCVQVLGGDEVGLRAHGGLDRAALAGHAHGGVRLLS